MKSNHSVLSFWLVLSIVVLLCSGCQYVDLSLLATSTELPEPPGPRPLAVLRVAPEPESFEAALTLFGLANSTSKTKPFAKRFPGVDVTRPAAAFLFLSDDGHADPLMYVPVEDYEKFLSGLDKQFRLNRAIATKINVRKLELVVMHLGDYAVFGYSSESIKSGPTAVAPWLDKFRSDSDLAFNWIGTKKKSDMKKLLGIVQDSFGSTTAHILAKADSIAIDIDSDEDNQLHLEAKINVDNEDKAKLNSQLTKLIGDENSITTNSTSDSQADFYVSLEPEASRESFEKIQLSLSDFAKTQSAFNKKRKPKRASPQSSDKALNQFTSLLKNSGNNSSCPPKRRRSGG